MAVITKTVCDSCEATEAHKYMLILQRDRGIGGVVDVQGDLCESCFYTLKGTIAKLAVKYNLKGVA